MSHLYKKMKSPVGELTLVGSDRGLAAVLWEGDDPARVRARAVERAPNHPILVRAERQLEEYFEGRRREFDLPLEWLGTEFQERVWRRLTRIPYGETTSYAKVAGLIGSPRACRAVGAANGRNPISIIAACHRVVGSDGKLRGFAGGLEAKAFLLEHERRIGR